VRRFLTWLAGAAGGLAAYRALSRRRAHVAGPPAPADEPADDPAQELRAKLAETRAAEPEPDDPDARRRTVHEHGRAAIDEMQR
jgi:hypothetical protein